MGESFKAFAVIGLFGSALVWWILARFTKFERTAAIFGLIFFLFLCGFFGIAFYGIED